MLKSLSLRLVTPVAVAVLVFSVTSFVLAVKAPGVAHCCCTGGSGSGVIGVARLRVNGQWECDTNGVDGIVHKDCMNDTVTCLGSDGNYYPSVGACDTALGTSAPPRVP